MMLTAVAMAFDETIVKATNYKPSELDVGKHERKTTFKYSF